MIKEGRKICVSLPYGTTREEVSYALTRPTQIQIGSRVEPHTHCDITWMTHHKFYYGMKEFAQIVYNPIDEKEVFRILFTKYRCRVVDIDTRLNQRQTEEINQTNTGKMNQVEYAGEYIQAKSFDNGVARHV